MQWVRIEISPSENDHPGDIAALLADLNGHGAEVVRRGFYGRRSAGELSPALIMVAAIAAAAIGTGFLNAMGADAWAVLKRMVGRAAASRHNGEAPTIILNIEFDDCEVILRPIADSDDLPEKLDKALLRLEQIGWGVDLWYVEETGEWLTGDEVLWRNVRKPEQNS